MLGQFSTVMYNHMIYYPYAQPVYPQPVPSYSHIQYYSPPYSLPPPYPVMQQPQYCEQLVHQPVHISQPCYVSSLTAAPITTYSQHQYWAGHAMPYQPYSYPCMPASMITYVHPQWETGFQQAPINYPFEHSPQVTSNREPTSAPFSFDNPTAPFDNPFQVQQQPQRQITEQQPEEKKSKIYYFDMNKDSRKPDKIIFNLNEMNKENVKPFFIDYFKTNSFFESIKGREERYTEALVFEQKIKEIGHHFNEIDLAQLSKPETLLKLTEFGGKTAVLKDSSDAEHHKIIEILKNNKENPSFKESIKEKLNEGIALQNKSDYRANQLRIALIQNNLKKEEAGQIAKAISILDNQFISQSKLSRSVSEHIDKLFNYHSPSPNPKYPTNHIASGVIAHQ